MKKLPVIYDDLFKRILQLDTSCFDLSMSKLSQHFITEEEDNSSMSLNGKLSTLTAEQLKEGVLLHDLSGIGLYLLAYLLAKSWVDGELFQNYAAVIVLPIEWIHLKTELNPENYQDFFRIWSDDVIPVEPGKALIIISGCTAPNLRVYDKSSGSKESALKQRWLEAIVRHKFSHIVISNSDNIAYFAPPLQNIQKVSLRPLHLAVTYHCENIKHSEFSVSGKILLEEALNSIELNYFRSASDNKSIRHVANWHEQVSLFLQGKHFDELTIQPEHVYPPLKPQALIRTVLERITNRAAGQSMLAPLVNFTTPAEWFSAAVTVQSKGKSTACYSIGNTLIARNLANQYIAEVDIDTTMPRDMPDKIKPQYGDDEVTELAECLKRLCELPNFDNFDTDALLSSLNEITSAYKKQLRKAFKKSSDRTLKSLKEKLKKDDPENGRLNQFFSRENASLAYHVIQKDVINETQGVSNIASLVRRLLRGEKIHGFSRLTFGLSATLLSETCRYPINFLTTLCLFDLLEQANPDQSKWGVFFSHLEHQDSHNPVSLTDAIISDIVHTLGGLQAMSHGNSYHQVKPDASKPKVGMHWVDFKSHLIIGNWLSKIIQCEKDLNPYLSGKLSLESIGVEIEDLLFDFAHKNLPHANPHLSDLFSRRLNSFDFMLIDKVPLRDFLSGNVSEILGFLKSNNHFTGHRVGGLDSTDDRRIFDQAMYNTMAAKFCVGAYSLDFGDKGKIFQDKKIGDKLVKVENTTRDNYEYQCFQLYTVLEIDPLFYAVHYHLAYIYLWQLKDLNKAMMHLNRYFENSNMKDGDLFFCALSLRIRAHWFQENWPSLDADIAYYLSHYHDVDDMDYWRIFLFRAHSNFRRSYINQPQLISDLYRFFSNVRYENSSDHQLGLELLVKILPKLLNCKFDTIQAYQNEMHRVSQLLQAHKCNLYLHRNAFFSPSRFAYKQQPYGPYRDYLCIPGAPSVIITDKLSIDCDYLQRII